MALNMPTVFGKTDDDLKPRYLQSDAKIINYWESGVSDEHLYTVTAGKTLYITDVVLGSSLINQLILNDNGVGGTHKCEVSVAAGVEMAHVQFATPISFVVDVYASTDNGCSVTIVGWEE